VGKTNQNKLYPFLDELKPELAQEMPEAQVNYKSSYNILRVHILHMGSVNTKISNHEQPQTTAFNWLLSKHHAGRITSNSISHFNLHLATKKMHLSCSMVIIYSSVFILRSLTTTQRHVVRSKSWKTSNKKCEICEAVKA
jgi:hypothetical protein